MRSARRRGFVTVTAISFIPLATIAMVALSTLCAADYRRTSDAIAQTQLRQLLLAGAVDARSHLTAAAVPSNWNTLVPGSFATINSALTIDGDNAALTITAVLADHHASQLMRFSRRSDHWIAVSTQLIPP